jgi:DNA repair exonuclease SbcCD nuclease subunit
MSRHLVLGDVHLGKGLSIGRPGSAGTLNSRVQDQLFLLDWVLVQGTEREVDSIIVTGDIYEEPRPHPALIQFFMAWLKKCGDANIQVDIVAGNHDIMRSGAYSISALDIIPAVDLPYANTYKDAETISYDDLSITLLPYRDRRMYDVDSKEKASELLAETVKQQLALIPKDHRKLLIGHLALEGSIPIGDEIDEMMNEIFCPLSMFDGYDYVWMGHIHKPQVMRAAKSGLKHIAHVGSMDRSDFGQGEMETDKILVYIDTEKPEFFEHITIPTRPLRKVSITVPVDKDTTDFVINSLHSYHHDEESLAQCIMRLEVVLENPEGLRADREKILKYLYSKLDVHHVCSFSERHNVQIVPIQNSATAIFDNQMSVPAAIEAFFAVASFETDTERDEVKQLAMQCYTELKEKSKNQKETI